MPRLLACVLAALAVLPACEHARQRPNLVLISVDTLRADRVSPATTPHLDAWARRHATVFRQAVAQAPWTLPSHASLLTGLDPLRHAANRPHFPLHAGVPTLAETLRALGYSTAAVTGGGWLDAPYGLERGFERFHAWSQQGRGDVEWEQQAARAAAWLAELPQPFFLFVHTYDVHDFPRAPRLPPDTPDGERARLYDAAVAHLDEHLAPLLARLSDDALRARTAVVVTADHGEALGEPTADGTRDYGHGSLRDPVLHVPLLVALPRDAHYRPRGAEALVPSVDRQVRLVDVAPTLLELAGAPAAPTTRAGAARRAASPREVPAWHAAAFDGVSLLPLLRGAHTAAPRPALAYFARPGHGLVLRDGVRFKYRFDDSALEAEAPAAGAPPLADTPREALFDLLADAAETHNLAPQHPATDGWRKGAQRLLERRTAGFALELHAGRGVELRLRGALLNEGAPTSPAWPAPALRRLGSETAALRPDARAVTLFFQPHAAPSLDVEAAGVSHRLDLRGNAPAAFYFDGRAWRAAVPHSTAAGVACTGTCVRLTRRGPAHGAASLAGREGQPATLDDEQRARLRALGYLP